VLIATEELDEQGQIMVKQLKNRYADISKNKKFIVGVDKSKMRLLDVGSNIVGDAGFGKNEDSVKPVKKSDDSRAATSKYDDWNFNT
jgi:hypothetical protein